MIKTRKIFAVMAMVALLLSFIPATIGFAASDNSATRTMQVASDYRFNSAKVTPDLRIAERTANDFRRDTDAQNIQEFFLTLNNAEWNLTPENTDPDIPMSIATYQTNVRNAHPWADIDLDLASPSTMVVRIANIDNLVVDDATKAVFNFPLYARLMGDGAATVSVEGRDSAVSSGTYTFANAASGFTTTTIARVNNFARTTDLATIQIDETRIGSLPSGPQQIKIKLPARFTWEGQQPSLEFTGGLSASTPSGSVPAGAYDYDGRTLTIDVNIVQGDTRGTIFVRNLAIRADRDAAYGEVYADISGTNITNQEIVVANYMTYNIIASIAEVKEVVSGHYASEVNTTAKITIEETLPGSMIQGREIVMVLPTWVKVSESQGSGGFRNVKGTTAPQLLSPNNASAMIVTGNKRNEVYFEVANGTNPAGTVKHKLEFEVVLSIEADQEGDIVATFSGAGMEEQEVIIAKAVLPVRAEVVTTDLRIGLQNQEAPDIIITETARGRIDGETAVYPGTGALGRTLSVTLPVGFVWSSPPTVEVVEGNVEFGPVALAAGPDGSTRVLNIPVRFTSTKPSTIKISNVKFTLDRTVPEGDFRVDIGGSAIVKNHDPNADIAIEALFNKARVIRTLVGQVITPAPGETHATTTFTVGSTTYTVVENNIAVDKTMDIAPYIKNGRTYLPIRFTADALGVVEDNILWDGVTGSVTIFKGTLVAQMTVNSTVLVVNGVQINMDVVPENVNGRVMLPVRWASQALGAAIEWDAESQTVVVTQ